MSAPLRCGIGAAIVEVDDDVELQLSLAALIDVRSALLPEATPTVTFRRSGSDDHAPPARRRDFHAGRASGWVEGAAIWLDGPAGTLEVSGATVRVHRLPPSDLREEFALVDAACALMMALRSAGRWHVHGACWDVPGVGACLVVGESGAGKSTTTIAAVLAGATWSCDDTAVLFDAADGRVWVGGLLRMFHVTEFTQRVFPALGPLTVAGRRSLLGKACVDPLRAFGHTWRSDARPLALLAVPAVHDGPTFAEPIDMAEALGALIESSAWVTVEALADRAEHMATLARACGQARAVRLHLGRDLLANPTLLIEALAATGALS